MTNYPFPIQNRLQIETQTTISQRFEIQVVRHPSGAIHRARENECKSTASRERKRAQEKFDRKRTPFE